MRLRLPPALQAEVRELIALSRTWAESAFGNAAAAATAAPTTTALLEACLSHGDCTVDELKAVVAARRRAQEQEGARPALRDLLLGEEGGLVLPQEPVKKERAAMVKRRAWLIARKQQREYNASVKNIRGLRPSEQAKKGMSEVRKTMKEVSIGFAMILVCVGVFFAFKLLADARGLSKGVVSSSFHLTVLWFRLPSPESRTTD